MSGITQEIIINLAQGDYNNLSYHPELLSNMNPYRGKSSYFAFLFVHDVCQLMIGQQMLHLFPGNIVLLRCNDNFLIHFLSKKESKRGHNEAILVQSSVSFPTVLLKFDRSFFTAHQLSLLTDCPIFYDLLRLDTNQNEFLFFDCNESNPTQDYVNLLLYECSLTDCVNEKSVQNALNLLMTRLHRIHHRHLIISESTMMPDYTIGSFLKYMTEHYSDVTLVSMAEHFNFHPSYLSGLFKKLSGYTFSEKLLMIRLEQAKRLLVTTNLNIETIIELIGFKEKSYFYKCFKRYYDMTPSKYRKLNTPRR